MCGTLLYICSLGSRMSDLFLMIAPLSLRSRYSRLVSYARYTACTVVKRRGDWRTRFVKTNSKRELLNFVITYSACVSPSRLGWESGVGRVRVAAAVAAGVACVLPRSRLLAVRMLIETTALYPIERLMRLFLWQIQMSRRLVMESDPFSPLLPFVSSTELIESICSSPERISS